MDQDECSNISLSMSSQNNLCFLLTFVFARAYSSVPPSILYLKEKLIFLSCLHNCGSNRLTWSSLSLSDSTPFFMIKSEAALTEHTSIIESSSSGNSHVTSWSILIFPFSNANVWPLQLAKKIKETNSCGIR